MKRIKKVYLPKWQRWWVVPLLVGVWLLVTYLEFFGAEKDELGIVGYLITTLVLISSGVVTWLMSGGKLPAYIIKEEENDQ